MKNKKGFTLAEVLITLTILGVVVAIVIPTIMRHNNEIAERTKMKKAIVDYEKIVENMRINEEYKTVNAMKTDMNVTGCEKSRGYFKTKIVDSSNQCQFETNDGVWWDISDITTPIVSISKNNECRSSAALSAAKGTTCYNKTFNLTVTQGTAAQGYAFIVNDSSGKAKNALVYARLINDDNLQKNKEEYCSCSGDGCCNSNCANKNICVEKNLTCHANTTCVYDCYSIEDSDDCTAERYIIDGEKYFIQRSGNVIYWTMSSNGDGTTGYIYNMYLYKNDDGTYEFISNTGGNGSFINKITYDKNGNAIEFYNYDEGSTCTKDSCNWTMNPFDQIETTYYGGNFEWEHYEDTGEALFGSTDRASGGCGYAKCTLNITHKIIDETVKVNNK